jgi:hypothetical protein
MSLSEIALLTAAGDRVYGRGEDYVRYVRGLRIAAEKAYASVQAKQVYTVELDWSGRLPDGYCTCPHHSDGNSANTWSRSDSPRSTLAKSTTWPQMRRHLDWKPPCMRWVSTSFVTSS